jgi:hypothetical protein
MFHTAEIRWFFEGCVPAAVQQWFDVSALSREEDPRVDSYLVLPGCVTTGVKVRQGHFEVKAQTSLPQRVAYENGLQGMRGSWVKWSSSLAGAPILQEQQGPETWVQVEKSRTMRLFSLSAEIEEKPPTEWLAAPGCFVEMSRLRLLADSEDWRDASLWWSFCLEAFGQQRRVIEFVDIMASADFFEPIADILAPTASKSYPEWLGTQPHRKDANQIEGTE